MDHRWVASGMSMEDIGEISICTTLTYNFVLFGRRVTTTVARNPGDISRWVRRIRNTHGRRLREGRLVSGLGVQWRPGSGLHGLEPTAVFQICVGHRCLVVQLSHCREFSQALKNFLADDRVCFAGVGVADDVRRLGFRGLQVGNPEEVRKLAVAKYGRQFSNASMGSLADQVLGFSGVTKDPAVGCSNWEAGILTKEQVKYASEDAYVAFRLGLRLLHEA